MKGEFMITENKSIPKYIQIEEYIINAINESVYQKGMVIPSEDKLAKMFSASRMTARKAIDELVTRGYLHRIKGRGTIVNQYNVEKTMNVSKGWKETMEASGYHTRTEVLEFCKVPANEIIAKNLNISQNTEVALLRRIRYADVIPMFIENAYLNLNIFPDIFNISFNDESLYYVMEHNYNIRINHVYQKIYTEKINGDTSKILFGINNSVAMVMENTSYDMYTRPIEYTKCYINGYNYNLRFVINKS